MQNRATERPWWAVIVLLLVFFPGGVIMLIYKVLNDKRMRMKNGRMMLIIGAISAILGLMGFGLTAVVGADDPTMAMVIFGIPAAVLLIFGAVLMIWGGTWFRKGSLYVRYVRYLMLSTERSIPAIAQTMGVNTMRAMETLEDMIVAAINEVFRKVDAEQTSMMGKMAGGMGGLGGGLF